MTGILKGKRIFIIEDDIFNLNVFTVSLKGSGARIEQNTLGYDIVPHIAECLPVDLILLDIKLRGHINGYAVYDQIRNSYKLMHIPVVAVTSLDPEVEIPKTKVKGFNGFIAKPIAVRVFPDYIARALAGDKIWINRT